MRIFRSVIDDVVFWYVTHAREIMIVGILGVLACVVLLVRTWRQPPAGSGYNRGAEQGGSTTHVDRTTAGETGRNSPAPGRVGGVDHHHRYPLGDGRRPRHSVRPHDPAGGACPRHGDARGGSA